MTGLPSEEFDVVVLGTGAAGFTAAVVAHDFGAKVAIFEKAELVGGTTAWSGGQVWIPNNPHMPEVGVHDSREKAKTYIMSLSRDMLEERLVDAYLDHGPEMVEYMEAKTPVQFYAVPEMPDYHPEFPGGSPEGGRTIEVERTGPRRLMITDRIEKARELYAQAPEKYFYPDQYSNDANWRAHYVTTGVEILEQTQREITHVTVCIIRTQNHA